MRRAQSYLLRCGPGLAQQQALASRFAETLGLRRTDISTLSGADAKVADVRRLCAELAWQPADARTRAVAVLFADKLLPASQNALLAALEEPQPYIVFLLISARPEALLPTVRSRCLKLEPEPDSQSAAEPDEKAQGYIRAFLRGDTLACTLTAYSLEKLERQAFIAFVDALLEELCFEQRRQPRAGLAALADKLTIMRPRLENGAGIGHLCGLLAALAL